MRSWMPAETLLLSPVMMVKVPSLPSGSSGGKALDGSDQQLASWFRIPNFRYLLSLDSIDTR